MNTHGLHFLMSQLERNKCVLATLEGEQVWADTIFLLRTDLHLLEDDIKVLAGRGIAAGRA